MDDSIMDDLSGVMDRSSIPNQIFDRIKQSARVELAYGESRKVGEKTIIPVALVSYVFGGGSGGGLGPAGHNGHTEDVGIGGGGGGGGGVRVQPVAVLEMTEDSTRLLPIIEWTKLATTVVAAAAAVLIVRRIFRGR